MSDEELERIEEALKRIEAELARLRALAEQVALGMGIRPSD